MEEAEQPSIKINRRQFISGLFFGGVTLAGCSSFEALSRLKEPSQSRRIQSARVVETADVEQFVGQIRQEIGASTPDKNITTFALRLQSGEKIVAVKNFAFALNREQYPQVFMETAEGVRQLKAIEELYFDHGYPGVVYYVPNPSDDFKRFPWPTEPVLGFAIVPVSFRPRSSSQLGELFLYYPDPGERNALNIGSTDKVFVLTVALPWEATVNILSAYETRQR